MRKSVSASFLYVIGTAESCERRGPQFNFRYLTFLIFLASLSSNVIGQRKDIAMAQPDDRFTVFAQRYWSSTSASETYFFYIQNNTNEEYSLNVIVTLDLACEGRKVMKLGYGRVRLKPRQTFNPQDGGEYTVTGGDTEAKRACRMKDGNGFTFLKSAAFGMTEVVNETQKAAAERNAESERERSAEQKRKQDEAERLKKMQEAETQRQNEEVQRQKLAEAERQKQEQQKAKINTTTASKNQDKDFRSSDNKQSTKNTNDISGLPEFFRTTDGRYFKKNADKLQQIDYDSYMALRHEQTKKMNEAPETKKLSPEEHKKLVDQIVADNNAAFNNYFKTFDDISKKFDQNIQAIAAGNAIKDTKDELNENSMLLGNYQSVDQLMADFREKMANVNRLTNNLTTQRNQQLNSAVDARFNQPGYEASIGAGMKLIGGIINSAKAAKEKKEAQEQLRLQQQIALNKIAAEEKKLLTGIRTDLFGRFTEAKFPSSQSNISQQTIYFFVYAYNPATIGAKQTELYVSNVFPISKYSDGTWPYKNTIRSEIARLTAFEEIMHGYYSNEAQAEKMRQGMIEIFEKTGGIAKPVSYKGKKSGTETLGQGKSDFWENGLKTDSTLKKPLSDTTKKKSPVKDSFWDN